MRAGAVAAGALALLAACDEAARSHVFAGRLYEADRGCLDDVTSLDVVDGPAPSAACDPACFVAPADADGSARAVYVSTMCKPYPPAFDTSGTDPRCAAAQGAYTRNTTCLADGGIANADDASARDGGDE